MKKKNFMALISLRLPLIFMLLVFCYLFHSDNASSSSYLDSAHGSSSYGVNRSSLSTFGYSRGICAHCHEQHASIGGSEPQPIGGPSPRCLLANNFSGKTTNLYEQSDNVCFYCHSGPTMTYQNPAFYNYPYSITFGGNPDTTPNNILDTFNSMSYHNLYDIYRFITGLSGSHPNFPNFPSNSNPCSGCHNVHIAKRSCNKPPLSNPYDPTKSAISRPSDPSNLWGDDAVERMDYYTTNYQPPRYYNSNNLEPDGSSSDRNTQAKKTPDYVTFCTDCHNISNTIYSTTLGRNLRTIDWNINEKHGKGSADNAVSLKDPYSLTLDNKVLSCLDCHEPHGAPNVMLIRKVVNGAALSGTISTITPVGCTPPYPQGNKYLGYLCNRCHRDDADAFVGGSANKWCYVHHESPDAFYTGGMCNNCHANVSGGEGGGGRCSKTVSVIDCNCCHYHGSTYTYGTTTWRTF